MVSKTTPPVLSIVILVGPTPNPSLASCMRSLGASAWKNYEIILVINSDSTSRARALARSYPQARIISMGKNTGVAGYNRGITQSHAPYIFFLDEDCELGKQTVSQMVRALEKSAKTVGAVAGNVFNIHQKQYFYHNVPRGKSGTLFTFPGGATAFKRKVFEFAGLFDEDFFLWLHEDDMALSLLSRGYHIEFHKNIIVRHNDQEGGFRPRQAYLIFRNKAWLNIKHFSIFLLPILVARDIIWILSYSYYKKTLVALWYALLGYGGGCMTLSVPLKKRTMLSWNLQMQLLKHYFSYRNK